MIAVVLRVTPSAAMEQPFDGLPMSSTPALDHLDRLLERVCGDINEAAGRQVAQSAGNAGAGCNPEQEVGALHHSRNLP